MFVMSQSHDANQCRASARWLETHALVKTPQGKFLAQMTAATETCAAGRDDKAACEAAKMCDFTYDDARGEGLCEVSGSWAGDQLKQCLDAARNADPVVKDLAVTAERCLDRSSSREACEEDAQKCVWTPGDLSEGMPAYCGVAPMHIVMELVGPGGFATILTAGILCELVKEQGQCDAETKCRWVSDGSKCAVDAVGVLAESTRSTTAKAYLGQLAVCAKGAKDAASCAAAGTTAIDCVYGPADGSTNVIPKEYGGDGGDGGGGWTGGQPASGPGDMACYPSFKMLVDALAPILGLGGGDGKCSLLTPAFDLAAGCAAANDDAARCDETAACAWREAAGTAPPTGGGGFTCALDPEATIQALLPAADADPVGAMEKVCAAARGGAACEAASSVAAAAALAAVHAAPAEDAGGDEGKAAGAGNDSGGGDDDRAGAASDAGNDTGGANRAKVGGYLVVAAFVFFLACVAPPVAAVNVMKRRGLDVCDYLPPSVRKYVPAAARPPGVGYEDMSQAEMEDLT